MKGLYIHIPFCVKKCKYCDFVSFAGCDDFFKKYVDELQNEMKNYEGEKVDTIFIGGGTPSLLSAYDLNRISQSVFNIFDVCRDYEFTVESNPKTLSEEKLSAMPEMGINRLSIGVQSFNDVELSAIGRIHNSYDAQETIRLAKKAGFSNINIDIMFSIPEQTKQSFKNTLKTALSLEPEHISCYSLILEEETELYREYEEGKITLHDEETDRTLYQNACNTLKGAGYNQYEISNFAKPGYECRHNLKYWNCDEYIGLGVSAHSYCNGMRYYNTNSLDKYLAGEYRTGKKEKLTIDDKIKEFVIMGLRKTEGIEKAEFLKRFKKDMKEIYKEQTEKFIKLGFMEETPTHIRFTFEGINVSNAILCEFV